MTLSTTLSKTTTRFGFCLLLAASASLIAQETAPPATKNPPLFKGAKPKKDDGMRMVGGVVRDAEDKLKEGAVVKLKDTKSLAIRSYITKDDGGYSFQGLSVGIDYELRAETREGAASPTKILSVYDNRREAVMNLKLEAKK